jgi:hypothetical protein
LIVEALKSAIPYYGLSQTLDIVEKCHPEEVVRELFHGLLKREGEIAIHCARAQVGDTLEDRRPPLRTRIV